MVGNGLDGVWGGAGGCYLDGGVGLLSKYCAGRVFAVDVDN